MPDFLSAGLKVRIIYQSEMKQTNCTVENIKCQTEFHFSNEIELTPVSQYQPFPRLIQG